MKSNRIMVLNFLKSLTEWKYDFNTQKHITVFFLGTGSLLNLGNLGNDGELCIVNVTLKGKITLL